MQWPRSLPNASAVDWAPAPRRRDQSVRARRERTQARCVTYRHLLVAEYMSAAAWHIRNRWDPRQQGASDAGRVGPKGTGDRVETGPLDPRRAGLGQLHTERLAEADPVDGAKLRPHDAESLEAHIQGEPKQEDILSHPQTDRPRRRIPGMATVLDLRTWLFRRCPGPNQCPAERLEIHGGVQLAPVPPALLGPRSAPAPAPLLHPTVHGDVNGLASEHLLEVLVSRRFRARDDEV